MSPDIIELLFSEFGVPGEFQPSVFYDKDSDCIRVILEDCSMYEECLHVSNLIDIMRDNYNDKKIVGIAFHTSKDLLKKVYKVSIGDVDIKINAHELVTRLLVNIVSPPDFSREMIQFLHEVLNSRLILEIKKD